MFFAWMKVDELEKLVKAWDDADRLIMVLDWLGPRWDIGYDDWVGDPDSGYQHNS